MLSDSPQNAGHVTSVHLNLNLDEDTASHQKKSGIFSPSTESCIVQIYPPDVVDGMMKLGAEHVLLGREKSADFVLADDSVSRRHAKISHLTVGYEIKDLGSTNGTFVNGQEIQKHSLKSGDTIQVGSFLFRFLSAGSVESKYHETVYSALTRDALTGCMNRRYLLESLRRELARAKRNGDSVCVALLDIDHFKDVNDTYGHLAGDAVLKEFAKRISQTCREDDMLARFGGEEFCLVLSATSPQEALEVFENCRQSVANHLFQTSVEEIEVTASFGFVHVQADSKKSMDEVLGAADQQLYRAKESGRNRVCG